jgi:DNA polymerase
MARFFPTAKISRVHGQHRDIDGRLFIPMYHPAAALHQQSLRGTIIEDFRKLPDLIASARERRRHPEPDPAASSETTQMRLFD